MNAQCNGRNALKEHADPNLWICESPSGGWLSHIMSVCSYLALGFSKFQMTWFKFVAAFTKSSCYPVRPFVSIC